MTAESGELEFGQIEDGPEVLKLSSKAAKPKEARMPLFELDGVVFSVLQNPGPALGLRYLNICRQQGVEAGTAFILEEMLGTEAYEALMNYEELTHEQYDWVMDQVVKRAIGPKEKPKARGNRGRSK